ncbi:hypothetical protein [Sphingobium sp. ba1]|jgi:hypothetical protein|uniref:hypothetical protein n=1 Tax=Sphingobium sp. ba1 TaxID=1522072 RepID=UPI0012E0BD87|nr:hypothetical protein [Sphingobium sp. ba1]
MTNGTGRLNDGNNEIMDEGERKGVTVRSDTSDKSPTISKVKQVGVDTRSREAFELLKLGEAICNLQVDQRKMRLNAEDMRFERDRYKASAAAFQDKLAAALNENGRLRDLREVLATLSIETSAALAERENERARLIAALDESEMRLAMMQQENERLQSELIDSRDKAEVMRQKYIEMTINIIKEANSGDVDSSDGHASN